MGQTARQLNSRKRPRPIAATLALVTAFVGLPQLFLPQQSHADDALETDREIRNVQTTSPNTGELPKPTLFQTSRKMGV